jgi:hypothetical protein
MFEDGRWKIEDRDLRSSILDPRPTLDVGEARYF